MQTVAPELPTLFNEDRLCSELRASRSSGQAGSSSPYDTKIIIKACHFFFLPLVKTYTSRLEKIVSDC
jgi:hypothetical protein